MVFFVILITIAIILSSELLPSESRPKYCYKSIFDDSLTVVLSYHPPFDDPSPFLTMKVFVNIFHDLNIQNSTSSEVLYYLKLERNTCITTLNISNSHHQFFIIVVEIILYNGINEVEFAFIKYKIHQSAISGSETFSDYDNIIKIYTRFVRDLSDIIPPSSSQPPSNIYNYISASAINKRCACVVTSFKKFILKPRWVTTIPAPNYFSIISRLYDNNSHIDILQFWTAWPCKCHREINNWNMNLFIEMNKNISYVSYSFHVVLDFVLMEFIQSLHISNNQIDEIIQMNGVFIKDIALEYLLLNNPRNLYLLPWIIQHWNCDDNIKMWILKETLSNSYLEIHSINMVKKINLHYSHFITNKHNNTTFCKNPMIIEE